ncbi:MAG: inorganic phosphate transporter, partial [Paracoccaceae bacterium]
GLMAGVFAMYLAMKGLKKIIKVDIYTAVTIGVILGAIIYAISAPLIKWQSKGLENRNKSIKKLFSVPLVISAGLLSFAHGANDVANAVGPLAAIVHTVESGDVAGKVDIPLWVMIIGALGISFGLLLYGPKLIKIVGDQITKLNPMRAYCVALSAAITVIIASWLGLPVSSTHIAVGGVFGVGFFREWDSERRSRKASSINSKETKQVPVKERRRRKLVRRSHFLTIIAAWLITVPAAATLSGTIFLIINSFV